MPVKPEAHLKITNADLAKPMRILLKTGKLQKSEEAVLSYDGEFLHIAMGGVTVAVPANGSWPGQARVLGSFIQGVGKVMPRMDPIPFVVQDGRLSIGTSSMKCAWQTAWTAQIEMPINATLLDYLALRHRHTNAEIMHSGLSVNVKHAEFQRDKLIPKALSALQKLGITESDIRRMVDEKIRQLPPMQ